jgi:NAD+ kinase
MGATELSGLLRPGAALGVFTTRGKDAYPEVVKSINEWASKHSILTTWGGPDEGEGFWQRCSVVVVLGGDGTLLAASHCASEHQCALLSLNQGRFGFLTDVTTAELRRALTALETGPCWIEERMMLESSVSGKPEQVFRALNDVVVHRGAYPRVIDLDAWVGDEHIGRLTGDGLVVCSPTGSTGYSLSCGGPVINPTMEAILCTPISPHTLAIRPVVVSSDETVAIELVSPSRGVTLLVDGKHRLELQSGDRVFVRRSALKLKLVRTTRRSFYETLRTKLRWGAREECSNGSPRP